MPLRTKLFAVRSGNVDINLGYLKNAGINGNNRSSSSYTSTDTAYHLGFYVLGVSPSGGPSARYHGFSLRCLQE